MVVLSSFCEPDSPVRMEQRNTRAILDKKDMGCGTLIISESTLCWKEGDIGFSLSYPHISLHAITSDPVVYSTKCLYIMIDAHVQMPGVTYDAPPPQSNSESDDESEPEISELIFVPENISSLSTIYNAIKECQALNSDLNDDDDDDENEEDIYEDAAADDLIDIGAGGDAEVANLANQLHDNVEINYSTNGDRLDEDMFEDAD